MSHTALFTKKYLLYCTETIDNFQIIVKMFTCIVSFFFLDRIISFVPPKTITKKSPLSNESSYVKIKTLLIMSKIHARV